MSKQSAEMLRREVEMQNQARAKLEAMGAGAFHEMLNERPESKSDEPEQHWTAELSDGSKVFIEVADASVTASIAPRGTRTGTTEQRIEGRTQEALTQSRE